ncbi:TnsD family transposase [Phosphitispora fastidiosa]|uniref:TnsD family transposase n=1 Tax=Phosphitispora fastidiosa TaxID=2837202 RepID=UPI001E4621B3|nr:TnsD family transposase [Phosphitispora fastidiosa]MBU7006890.1 hypothetical protein [Phosphitispora fastidiosa]
MLPFFPRLYEDEILYSWLARYHLRSCNVSPKATMNDLFGSSNVLAVPDLPTHLDGLYQRIKHFDIPEVKHWIEKHTFFNYYTLFGKEGVSQQVFDAMTTGSRLGAIHMMTGMMASSISEPTYFRFCPYCVEEDFEKFGETYWHLSHQLPGVLVCLKHDGLLQNSLERFRGKNKHTYEAATKENCNFSVKPPKYNDKTISHLKEIAADILKLSVGYYSFSWSGIQSSYKYLLQKHDFATVNGTVNQRTLAEEFCWFYGDELLVALQSQVDTDNPACWLKAITRKHRKAFHPIRHLLFIQFFKEGIDTFYQYADKTYQPFGRGPYPCLNAAADHYKQLVISNVNVTICTDTRNPVGTFSCSCGFIYSRRGPDRTLEDCYRIGTIKQFGPVWEDKLQQLIYAEKLSCYAAAKKVNVDIATVKKYANTKMKAVSPKAIDWSDLLSEKQAQWLQLQDKNPNSSKTQLRNVDPALYTWLYRHARKWLENNSPKKQASPTVNKRVDWKQRDSELVKEIFVAVTGLLSAKKPVHINISRIGKEIGKLALLEKHLEKLPLTAAYLSQVVETREQFQIRRVQWAAKRLFEHQEEISEWKMKRIAGLKSTVSDKVQQEIMTQARQYQLH